VPFPVSLMTYDLPPRLRGQLPVFVSTG
jgi:hypothetical protein